MMRCIGWRNVSAAYSDALPRLSKTFTAFVPPIAIAVVSVVGRPVPSSTTIDACRPLVLCSCSGDDRISTCASHESNVPLISSVSLSRARLRHGSIECQTRGGTKRAHNC